MRDAAWSCDGFARHRVARVGAINLTWHETRLEAVLLPDSELADAIAARGPVRPSVSSIDIRATRVDALTRETALRRILSAHERMAETVVRRR